VAQRNVTKREFATHSVNRYWVSINDFISELSIDVSFVSDTKFAQAVYVRYVYTLMTCAHEDHEDFGLCAHTFVRTRGLGNLGKCSSCVAGFVALNANGRRCGVATVKGRGEPSEAKPQPNQND
jgi:hypothetical protein